MKNALRRTLVLLLALTMILTSLPIITLAADKGTTFTYSQGDIIGLGSYPQTEVTDETLKSNLTKKAGSTETWISYNYYQNGEKSDFMKYTDIEHDGEKYRGVYFTSYRPYYTSDDGEYNNQEDNGYNTSTIYWFKYEPILWQILSYDAATDTAVVLSKSTIDSQEFYDNYDERTINGKTIYANNYEYSNIRTWLNSTFYNTAFTSTEKSAIVATTLDNSEYSTYCSGYDSNSTTDNVWLLSYAEAQNADYGFTTDIDSTETRQTKTTDYAKSQGIYVSNTNKCTSWRLRSAGNDDYRACYVYSDGYVYSSRGVHYTGYGVRPSLTLHLKSEIVPSCAHAFTDTVTPATCEKGGYTTHTCSKCGETIADAKTSPLGHNFAGEAHTASDGTVTRKCTRCDKYGTPATTTVTVDDIVAKVDNTKKSTDTAGSKIVVSSVSVSASDVYALATGISIKDKDGNDVDSTRPLATGMKITLLSGETVETSVLGDVDGDGDVDVSDARLGLRAAVKLETLTGVYEIAAKVGHDQISVSEARLILRAAVKLDNPKDWLK